MPRRSPNGSERRPRHVTLADVASAAGVSLATASRALSPGARPVPEPVRRHVAEAAAELGYVSNAHARSLAGRATTTVGLLVHDVSDPYYAEVAAGVVARADAEELLVLIVATEWEPARVMSALSMLQEQRVRAVVLGGSGFDDADYRRRLRRETKALRTAGIGIASISDHGVPVDMIVPDNRAGAAELARALADLGHRRFAVIAGRRDILTLEARVDGFREALAALGIELADEDVVWCGSSREDAYNAASELVRRSNRPTAIFAVTDMLAVAALGAVLDRGFEVPADISIAGFTDVAPLRDVRPALTTVRLPIEEIGRAALALALAPPATRRRKQTVPVEVVLRASTGPPPPGQLAKRS